MNRDEIRGKAEKAKGYIKEETGEAIDDPELEADLLVEQNKVAARRLTATLVASIEGAMLQERPDVTRTVIQELRQNSPVDAVDIYRRAGMEAFTDLTTAMEVDKNAGLAPEVMSNIKKMAQPPGKKINDPLFARAVETVAMREA